MRAQAPFHAVGHAGIFEVVAARGREVEERLRYGCGDGVVAAVIRAGAAEPISVEARLWLIGKEC